MADVKQETAAQEFKDAAAAAPQPRVTLEIDGDVAQWLKDQFKDWQGHARELLRFYMDTSQVREVQADPEAWEPGEMLEPPPAPPPPA
jgi:BrnA antitoxin of type II toxin-antitoxin system